MSVKLITNDGDRIPVKFWSFPGGERGCRIEDVKMAPGWIDVDFRGSDDLIDMLMLRDAIRSQFGSRWRVCARVRYMPYARQDRVSCSGESHSLRVAASIINSCGFDRVEVWDPHSTVTEALVDNMIVTTQAELFHHFVDADIDAVMLAPDNGALKKIYDVAQGRQVLCAEKTRDPATGKLSGCRVEQSAIDAMVGRQVWVVDDICDGGGTFIQLINYIRANCSQELDINLFVTHGIFSRGKQCLFDAGYRQVISANDWTQDV